MDSKELNKAAQEIIDHFEGLKRVELQALTEKARLYSDGFEFSRRLGERVEKLRILSASISGTELLNTHISYRCEALSWRGWSKEPTPITELAITSFIKHFPQEI